MQTSENAAHTTSSGLTCSAEGSPAKTSATLVCGPALRENGVAFGVSTRESLANYDPVSSSWRMSQLCLDGEWAEFSETWPRSGMTRSGKLFRLPTSARRTSARGSGYWLTPSANDHKPAGPVEIREMRKYEAGVNVKDCYKRLRSQAAAREMLPTPTSTMADKGGRGDLLAIIRTGKPSGRKHWPTPRANDAEKRGNFDVLNPRNGLPAAVKADLSTPAADATGSGQLNPTWVEWLMGYPPHWTLVE